MDFLNKAVAQFNELFKGMTPGGRMTAGMLLVMIIISLVYLVSFHGTKADMYLYGGRALSPDDIAKIQSSFADQSLDGYELEGTRVRVPRRKLNQYMQALTKSNFAPESVDGSYEDYFDSNSSFFPDPDTTRAIRDYALELRLGKTLAQRPEIKSAVVRSAEKKMLGFPPTLKRTAAVVICGTNDRPISHATFRTVRALSAAWLCLPAEDVAVTDNNGHAFGAGEELDGLSKEASKYAQAKAYYENYYREKIEESMSVYGGDFRAAVNVEMETTLAAESTKYILDPQPVPKSSESFTKTEENRPAAGARPGAEPNQVAGNTPRTVTSVNHQESSSDETMEKQANVLGHEMQRQETAGLVPSIVTATVSIPRSYFKKVWAERNPPAEGETLGPPPEKVLKEIEGELLAQVQEQVVKTLPPLDAGTNPFPQVKVAVVDDLTIDLPEPPSMMASGMAWFSINWKTIGLFLLGLASLFVLRSMVKSITPPAQAPIMQQAVPDTPMPEEEEEFEEEAPAILHRRTPATGSSLREELTAMVHEDPDAAANVLRTWIGDAA